MAKQKVDLERARLTLRLEGQAIAALAQTIGESFQQAVQAIFACQGTVVLTGIGKAGIIAQKISATFASTGTPSIYLHPVEALHGDLGRVQRGDVVIALSDSGSTTELIRCLDHVKGRGAKLIALTGDNDSLLAKHADMVVCYGPVEEACPLGLAPTVSTSCMLALGDALAMTVMQMRDFQPEDFAAFHPAGSLGLKLLKVEEAMTFTLDSLPLVSEKLTLAEALAITEKIKRRPGAMLVVDERGFLTGIFTDGDLRRLVLSSPDGRKTSCCMGELKHAGPKHVRVGQTASEALAIMNRYRIDELPVLDEQGRPVGLIDVQDLLGIKTVSDDKG